MNSALYTSENKMNPLVLWQYWDQIATTKFKIFPVRCEYSGRLMFFQEVTEVKCCLYHPAGRPDWYKPLSHVLYFDPQQYVMLRLLA